MNTFKIASFTCAKRFVGWGMRSLPLVFLFFFFPSLAHAWTIDHFDSVVTVSSNADVMVEETITVNFTEEKHGIFRSLPTSYRNTLGDRLRTKVSILEVLQDGEPGTFLVYKSGGNQTIQIGDGDVLLTGEHVYTISYTYENALRFFETYDELYWNVTGVDWEVPIASVTALVVLPEEGTITQTACYTGEEGSVAQNCGEASEGNTAAFVARDFLTVAIGFEKGTVVEPTAAERALQSVLLNAFAVIPIFLSIAVVVYWFRFGRDPRLGTIIAEFEPPDDLWAVYTGRLVRAMFTSADLAAMLVQMAVAGYIKFSVQKEKKTRAVTLIKTREEEGLDAAHAFLFETIFDGKSSVSTDALKGVMTPMKLQTLRQKVDEVLDEKHVYVKHSKRRRTMVLVVASLLFAFALFTGGAFGMLTTVLFFLCAGVYFLFGLLMPKKTVAGIQLTRRAFGFKLFLHTAERYRSKWQEEQNLFERFLPYAIVFGDTKTWAKHFSHLTLHEPSWYTSNVGFTSASLFTSDVLTSTHAFSSVMRTTTSSGTGSGGGGFSGGGAGGGGGGSW